MIEDEPWISINTKAKDVLLIDRSAWVFDQYGPFTIQGANEIAVNWIGPEHLEIVFSMPGESTERIYRQSETWRSVKISYRMLKMGQSVRGSAEVQKQY